MRRPSRCRPTSRPGSRRTSRRTSWPACSPTTRACTPSGSSSTTPASSASACTASTSTPAAEDVRRRAGADVDDREGYAIRLALAEVKGINAGEVDRIVAGPALPLALRLLAPRGGVPAGRGAAGAGRRVRLDLPHRRRGRVRRTPPGPAHPPRPAPPGRRARPPRPGPGPRRRAGRGRGLAAGRRPLPATSGPPTRPARNSSDPVTRERHPPWSGTRGRGCGDRPPPSPAPRPRRVRSGRCSSPCPGRRARRGARCTGLPEMTGEERMQAELEILGLDVSRHVVDALRRLPRRARGHPQPRPAQAPQQGRAAGRRGEGRHPDPTDPHRPPRHLPDPRRRHRPGRRTFFEDAQGPYAATVFHSWLLVVRGELRRTGRRGVSLRATGAW